MPIPIIKRSVEEQKRAEEAQKRLSLYTENIDNAYTYYLEKVACLAMKGKFCVTLTTASNHELGLDTNEYILQIPGCVHCIKEFVTKDGKVSAVQDEYIDKDGFYNIITVNYLTNTYIRVRKGGYSLNLESGTPNLGRKYPEEHYYYDKKNGYIYGGRLRDKETAEKFATKIDKSLDELNTLLIQYEMKPFTDQA